MPVEGTYKNIDRGHVEPCASLIHGVGAMIDREVDPAALQVEHENVPRIQPFQRLRRSIRSIAEVDKLVYVHPRVRLLEMLQQEVAKGAALRRTNNIGQTNSTELKRVSPKGLNIKSLTSLA